MKSLVIYFSRDGENYAVGNISKGNSEVIAEYIQEFTNATLFKCEPLIPYSSEYKKCVLESVEKKKNNARPKLKKYLSNIADYDVIYIGGPIYCGEYPYEIYSQLDLLDFKNKIIKPFTTHEGSKLGMVMEVLKKKCDGAIIEDGLAIQGKNVYLKESKNQVKEWVITDK